MAALLVLFAFAALCAIIWRLRRAPTIHAVTAALWIGAYFWNQYAVASCDGGCDIRVDLILVAPLVLFATALSLRAAFSRK